MIERLAKEIGISLKNKCYMSALTMSAMIPDICGKAEYPEERSVGKRYKQWYQKYVLDEGGFGLQLSSDMAYSIRCSLLHEGNPSIDKEKCNVKCFAFIISDSTANKTLESSLTRELSDGNKIYEVYNLHIELYCGTISTAARKYYRANKDKFDFINYRIINTADVTALTFRLSEDSIRVKL